MRRVHPRRQFFYDALAEGLKAFAERYFHLSEPDGTGTRRDRLLGRLERLQRRAPTDEIVKAIAALEAELEIPSYPPLLSGVWTAYLRLRRRAPHGFAGSQPIGWEAIDAFCRCSGVRLSPWETGLIEMLDDSFLHPSPRPVAPEGQAALATASAADTAGVRDIVGTVGERRVVVRRGRTGVEGEG